MPTWYDLGKLVRLGPMWHQPYQGKSVVVHVPGRQQLGAQSRRFVPSRKNFLTSRMFLAM